MEPDIAMKRARYLIAKYIPDAFRNEPRNVGVIVWSEAGTAARFVGTDKNGDFIGGIPSFVVQKPMFKQWVKYWLEQIKKPSLNFIGQNKSATIESPDFIQALLTGNSSNFVLQEAGEVMEEVNARNLNDVASYLFSILVSSEQIEEAPKEAAASMVKVKRTFEDIVRVTPLFENQHFKKDLQITCTLDKALSVKRPATGWPK